MKKALQLLVLVTMLVPTFAFAQTKNRSYESKNLEETFKEESQLTDGEGNKVFDYDLSGYTENDKQITIYLFRGRGCSFCNKFLVFLNSIVPEYGKYFKLQSYEVWNHKDNSKLLNDVAEFLDEDAGGVPYIIIGDQVFPGYAEVYNDAIKQAIVDLYNSDNRYDVLQEMEKAEQGTVTQSIDTKPIILWSVIPTVVGTIVILAYSYMTNETLTNKVNSLEKNIIELKKELKENAKKEIVKEIPSKEKTGTKTTKKANKKKTDEK